MCRVSYCAGYSLSFRLPGKRKPQRSEWRNPQSGIYIKPLGYVSCWVHCSAIAHGTAALYATPVGAGVPVTTRNHAAMPIMTPNGAGVPVMTPEGAGMPVRTPKGAGLPVTPRGQGWVPGGSQDKPQLCSPAGSQAAEPHLNPLLLCQGSSHPAPSSSSSAPAPFAAPWLHFA